MRVTPSQFQELSRARLLAVASGVATTALPHRLPAGQDANVVVSRFLELANSYGITGERAQVRFVCLALIAGEDHVRQPDVAQRFRAELHPDSLVDRMLKSLARGGAQP